MIEDATNDAVDAMTYRNMSSNILPPPSPHDLNRAKWTWTRMMDPLQHKLQQNQWIGVMNDDLKMLQMMLSRHWHIKTCQAIFITSITARFEQSDLDLNENDGPTTTQVTAESVNWSNEWCFEDDTTMLLTLVFPYKHTTSTIPPLPSPHDPNGAN